MKKLVCFILLAFGNLCFSSEHLVVVSDRHHFKDADQLSSSQYKRFVAEEHPHHSRDMSPQEWENLKQRNQVALIIHGYNADYDKAVEYFKDVYKRSAHLYDKVICYLWPSGDEFWEYYEAEERVEDKKLPKRLATLISEINAKSQRIDVIAHSMGCRLILESLQKEPIGSVGKCLSHGCSCR